MPCYKPLMALLSRPPGSAKQKISFRTARHRTTMDAVALTALTPIPCGQCIGCRLERSRQWAIRLSKEAKLHGRSSFLTLTYSDSHLPLLPDGRSTLVLADVQRFLKRLRKEFSPHPLRFFQCGEYGEHTSRPHHHMILFGEDFCKDRFAIQDSRSGFPQWESPTLSRIWGLGHCVVSEFSFESAAYCARYTLKKWTGRGSSFFYSGRKPEFVTMSRRPGIAAGYFDEFVSDIFPSDEVVLPGRGVFLPPKFFDKLLERADPELFAKVKAARTKELDFFSDPDSTDTRLATRERVKLGVINSCLKRKL